MKAMVYYGENQKRWEDKPVPVLQAKTDALVKIKHTTICGTDLHVLKGSVPTIKPGTTLGHEGVGTVIEVGSHVSNVKPGDTVLISCNSSCGRCDYCKRRVWGHCRTGGWILGHTSDGCQAEYVRIPHADNSLYLVPDGMDHKGLVMLSDIFPTGLEVGVIEGRVHPGCTLAIVGSGPVGLAALLTSQFYSPSDVYMVDIDPHRLEVAKSFGASRVIDNREGLAVEAILDETGGQGVDVVIEAIGSPAGWYISEKIVKSGGNIAILGVHGKSVTLHLEEMWKRNFTMTAGLVHTTTIAMLLKIVQSGKLEPHKLISHYFGLGDMEKAYETFANASEHCALKVLVSQE